MQELGLGFDDWDLDYYTHMFRDDVKRDPTNVELFDIAQSNSEHSRHWFFKADIQIDGASMPQSLFDLVKVSLISQRLPASRSAAAGAAAAGPAWKDAPVWRLADAPRGCLWRSFDLAGQFRWN